MQHPNRMTNEIRNLIVLFGTIITVTLQFWGLRKPAETKIQILLWLAELSGAAAIIAAAYFGRTTDNIGWPSACAAYNFLVQVVLFLLQRNPVPARVEILKIVVAAMFLAVVNTSTVAGALFKTQARMIELHGAIVLPTPTPSPSPTP
jgi:hypothetical protein